MSTLQEAAAYALGLFDAAQDALFEHAVQPVAQWFGMAGFMEQAYAGTGWLVAGAMQIAVLLIVLGPLQRRWPLETVPKDPALRAERRRAVAIDVLYTLIDRLGLLRLVLFFSVEPLWNALFGQLAVSGVDGWHLDQWIAPLWPGVSDTALAGFVVYLLVYDGVGYALHRAQHGLSWWWALHAVHHSQRHMTIWSDSRNHLLDTLLIDSAIVVVARVIGVPPGQFVLLVAFSQLIESLSHANLRLGFGRLGERLLVGPTYHRLHHAIGVGHESNGPGSLGGCNFSALFPLWDLVFRTARYDVPVGPTGIRDQLPGQGGVDYGRGFWAQQRLGLVRLWQAIARRPSDA